MGRKLIMAELTAARPAQGEQDGGRGKGAVGSTLPNVRGLLFDVGGVLYDDTVWRRWLMRLLSHLGLRAHYSSFFRALDSEYMVGVYTGRETFYQAFSRFLGSAGLSLGQIDEVLAACQGRRRELEESTRPLPGVRGTLARLRKRGMKLGVLSDSELPATEIRARLEQFAAADTFCAVVTSFDVGCVKATPICYQRTLRQMGLPAEQVAYVGHDPAALQSARRMGMATVAFNAPGGTVTDVHLDRFEQLAEILPPAGRLKAAG
ncbi:MAG: HAD family hydrolase [Pirellulales bacterium]